MADNVHQPKHYTAGAIECIDAIHAALGEEGFKAYCIGNAIKYQWRYRLKNGQEDLRKASVYLLWATTGNPSIKLEAREEAHHAAGAPMPAFEPLLYAVDDDEPPLRACVSQADAE